MTTTAISPAIAATREATDHIRPTRADSYIHSRADLAPDAPAWLDDLICRVGDHGPAGYLTYIACKALDEIARLDELPDGEDAYDIGERFAELFVSDWIADRVDWLSQAPNVRAITCDEAAERYGLDSAGAGIAERLACGQRHEARLAFDEVMDALRDLA